MYVVVSSVMFSLADHSFFFGCFVVISFFPLIDVCEQSSDFSDISESAADYFSRSNRRGSVVSDLDDLSIPDLDAVSGCVLWAAVQHRWLADCCDAWCRKITHSLTLVITWWKWRAIWLAEAVAVVQKHGLGKCNMNVKEVCESFTCLLPLYDLWTRRTLASDYYLDSNLQMKKGLTAWPCQTQAATNFIIDICLFLSDGWKMWQAVFRL